VFRDARLRQVLGVAAGCTLVASLANSCTIVNGLEIEKCNSAQPPSPPQAVADGDGTTITSIILAFDFGSATDPVGFDIDSTCTCVLKAQGSCKSPSGNLNCDLGMRGIDNAAGQLITQLDATYFNGSLASQAAGQAAGGRSVLMQVTGYNGRDDDTSVLVSLFPTAGVETRPSGDAGTADTGTGDAALQDASPDAVAPDGGKPGPSPADAGVQPGRNPNPLGGDTWLLSRRGVLSVGGANLPKIALNGYVRGGTLVARSTQPINVPFGATVDIAMNQPLLVASIVRNGESFAMRSGTLTGLWFETDAIRGIFNFRTKGKALCELFPLPTVQQEFAKSICNSTDIRKDGNPSGLCDGLSLALRFTAVPGTLGSVYDDPETLDVCKTFPTCK
jgi:hypothetical protein